MKLNEIRDNKGARKSLMRVCRGQGCGKGETGGRGVKGQKSRTGVAIKGYEGGQMPIYRRLPKRGFNNIFRANFAEINLGLLQRALDSKALDATKEINAIALMESGLIKKAKDGIRLLGTGRLKTAVTIRVTGASKSAISAVEKVGGTVIVEPIKKTVLEKGKKKEQSAESKNRKAKKATKKAD